MTIGYSEFINQLEQAGYNTTNLNTARGEADFSDYGNALSPELQAMITDSFDCPEDYALQEAIAALYGNKSNLHRSDFLAACRAAGYEVNVEYVKSSYIPDNKADGRYDTDISSAHIGVYTISDGKGGQITIADANGNGALEIEELFMNQILQGVAVDVESLAASKENGTAWTGSAQGASGNNSLFGNNTTVTETKAEEAEEEVSQSDFDSAVEDYLSQGYSMETATASAAADLDADGMTYTGSMEELASENEEQATTQATQKSFNTAVNEYLQQGKTMEEAIELAKKDLDVDMEYTGIEQEAA